MGRFLLTQMAAVAELEVGLIGERTKNALAAVRKRIEKTGQRGRPDIKRLGNPNGARALKGTQVGNAGAVARIKENASQRAGDLKAIVEDIKASGITTVRGIADELHARGIRAPRGDTWRPTAVARLLSRLSA
jgi:DNA invertase Pin-like site-specific DNA recombinase